ncbi:MAG: hypothetical protein FRX49_06284 [Trebouxia sp. A1-2]|nr:MAG: hypothetical protein FRX49_06284 [Trebouxia sp. A1-2]
MGARRLGRSWALGKARFLLLPCLFFSFSWSALTEPRSTPACISSHGSSKTCQQAWSSGRRARLNRVQLASLHIVALQRDISILVTVHQVGYLRSSTYWLGR